MLDALNFFITDIKAVKPEEYLEPHHEPCDHDVVVGPMQDHLKAMYTVCRRLEKTRDTYGIEIKYMSPDKQKESQLHFAEIDQTFFIFFQLLIFETKHCFNLWDKEHIVFFTEFRVGYMNPPDIGGFINKIGIKVVG